MADLDQLNIKIKADASGANRSIKALNKNLEALAQNLNNVNSGKGLSALTSALNGMSTSSKKLATSTKSVKSSFSGLATSTKTAEKGFKSLAFYAGKLYANYFLLIRGIKQLSSSLNDSMDYVEIYNYYNVALQKIAKQYDDTYKEMGEDNAKTYVSAYKTTLNELTQKMTGYSVGANGELFSTGSVGLGMNPEQLMNFQAQLSSITNAAGVLGQVSIDTSKALSMLAGDLSSLTNTDLTTVMNNLTSAMIGQSRAVYKYGIDITNATLSQYALSYGIDKSVSEMTQSEKMQLRLLAILNESKIAWGDLANTVDSSANQYRVLQQQVANTSRIFGNLFLPIVQKMLPYVNALVIAVNDLLTSFGFTMFGENWLKDLMDGISGGSASDALEDIEDEADSANDSVKALKRSLLGFDEINALSANNDSSKSSGGSGVDLSGYISDALAEYETVWNKALEGASTKASDLAKVFEKALEPVKKLFTDMFSGDWFSVGQDVSKIATSILDTFNKILDKVDWNKIGNNIGQFLAGLDWVDILFKFLELKFKIWDAIERVIISSFQEAPLETAFLTAFALFSFDPIGKVVGGAIAKSISTQIATSIASLGGISGMLTTDLSLIMGAGTFAEIGLTIAAGVAGSIVAGLAGYSFGSMLAQWITGESTGMGTFEELGYLWESIFDGSFADGLKEMFNPGISQAELFETKLKNINERTDKIITNAESDAKAMKDLVDEYYNLYNAPTHTVDELDRMKEISKEMIEKYPELLEYYERESGLIKTTADNIQNVIDNKLKEIKMKALEDKLVELYKQQFNAQNDLNTATEKYNDITEKKNKADEQNNRIMNAFINNNTRGTEAVAIGTKQSIDYAAAQREAASEVKNCTNELNSVNSEISKLTGLYPELANASTNATDTMVTGANNANTATKTSTNEIKSSYSGTFSGISSGFTDLQKKSETTTTSIAGYSKVGAQNLKNNYTNALTDIENNTVKTWNNISSKSTEKSSNVGLMSATSLISSFGNKMSNVPDVAKSAFEKILERVNSGDLGYKAGKDFVEKLAEGVKNNGSVFQSAFSKLFSGEISVTNSDGKKELTKTVFTPSIAFKADGGPVGVGELFVARESGPEMVGKIGNTTAVANNEQITTAISSAVYGAMMSVMSQTNNNSNITVEIDGQAIFSTVKSQSDNYMRRTGRNAFA